jgi:hypothetical protein
MWDELQGEPRPTGDLGTAGLQGPLQLLQCGLAFLEFAAAAAYCDSVLSSVLFSTNKYEPRLKHIKYKQKTK